MKNEPDAPHVDVTAHDNDLNFDGAAVTDFSVTDYSITSGQPYKGVSIPNGATLRVIAGRKGSGSVASWFNSKSTGDKLPTLINYTQPDSLNFAVKGVLKMECNGASIVIPDFIVAQGHSGTSNYWWITAPGMSRVNNEILVIGTVDCMVDNRNAKVAFSAAQSIFSDHGLGVKVV